MKISPIQHLDNLIERYPALSGCKEDINKAFEALKECYGQKKKLLVCGNGGSAADAEHMVGELMKSFILTRKLPDNVADTLEKIDKELGKDLASQLQGALPAIALDGHVALSTAYMNDCNPTLCFAQQVNGFGTEGDVLIGITTSGNSKNVLYAAVMAKSKNMKVIGLTGARQNKLEAMADICIKVPETDTFKVQELHLPVYHCICLMLESEFFD